jgi:hypothetical protein
VNLRQKLIMPAKSEGFFQPAPAWLAILALVFLTILGIYIGAGRIINIAFPSGAFIAGTFLYFRYPILYISFTWSIWFATPFLRRLIDYRIGYTEGSPILLAPYLVTAITLVTVFQHLPKVHQREEKAFILSLASVFYGLLIGLVNYPSPLPVTREFLDWMTPIAFGFHLLVNWRDFAKHYQNIQRTFAWGVLVIGTYGIIQYIIAPDWDLLWLSNSGMVAANGYSDKPLGPFAIRVFSTLSSVEPFAAFMSAALLLLLGYNGPLKFISSGVGYFSFLLCLVRSAWIGWLGGLLIFATSLKAKQQMRLVITVVAIIILITPLASLEPFSGVIGDRLQTLSNLREDGSAQGRQEFFQVVIGNALTKLVGDGIGSGMVDSAIIALLLNLGWIGSIGYLSGMLTLIIKLFKENDSNLFFHIARAMVVSCLIRLPVNGSSIVGIGGLIIWSFLGLSLAAQKYYLNEKVLTSKLYFERE